MSGCIVYLLGNSQQNLDDLNKSLSLLYQNYLIDFPCPVLLFFEEESSAKISRIIEEHPNIVFDPIAITFSLPDYNKDILEQIPEFFPHPTHGNGPLGWGHPGFSLGYRHMCNFFAGDIFLNQSLQKYNYYLRLDTDSFLLRKIDRDLFIEMKVCGAVYGYIEEAIQYDNPKVIDGMWQCLREHYPEIETIPQGKMYYNNFEICDLDFFRSKPYQDFYNLIKASGGIYIKRWGDAPIRYVGVNLLKGNKKCLQIKNITYQHGAIYKV